MYYGNTTATATTSNGTTTFLFFDDFETASFSRWTTEGGGWNISGTYVYAGSYSAYGTGGGLTNITKTVTLPATSRIHLIFSANSTINNSVPIYGVQSGAGKYLVVANAGYYGALEYYNTTYRTFSTNLTYTSKTWYEIVALINTNTTANNGNYYQVYSSSNNVTTGIDGGTLTYNGQVTSVLDNTGNPITGYYIRDASFSGIAIWVDNVYISKWSPQPPSIFSIGSETGLGTLPQIQDVKVFEGFKNTGDWLITIRYLNLFTPYYDTYDVRQYFALQLLDTTGTVRATTVCPAWGNKVGCIYLAPSQVTALNWGTGYTVRIYGTFTGNPYTSYTLQGTDWIGVDLTKLDSWVITSAGVIGTYYSDVLTTNISTRGEVLNTDGASIMNTGIPGLMTVRPNLFQISKSVPSGSTTTFVQTNRQSGWQAVVGTDTTQILTDIGSFGGVDGRTVGVFACIVLMIILAAFCLAPGHSMASNVLVIAPLMILATTLLFLDQVIVAVAFLVLSVVAIWQLVLNKGA